MVRDGLLLPQCHLKEYPAAFFYWHYYNLLSFFFATVPLTPYWYINLCGLTGLHLLDPSFVKDAPSPELPEPNEAVALTLSQIKSFLERICTMSPASVVSSRGLGLCLVQFLHSAGYPAAYFESNKMQEAFKMAESYVEKARASPLEVCTREG